MGISFSCLFFLCRIYLILFSFLIFRVIEVRKDLADYASENLISLNIFIKDPVVKKMSTEEKISLINFIGSIGGILGLFSGFSVISLIEIIYFVTIFNRV